jgi:phospholipase C
MRLRGPVAALMALAITLTPAAARTKAFGEESIPTFAHIVVVVLENESASATWGPGSVAHYINSLVPRGVFTSQYYATGHASLDNYIAMVSGQPASPLTGSDCLAVSLWVCVQGQQLYASGRNLADQLEARSLTWKEYADGAPTPCFHASYAPTSLSPDPYQGNSQKPPAKNYADRHNPFIYFADIIENASRCAAHVRPFTDLANDIATNRLPAFSFITPDTCHDGHDSPCSNGQPGGLVSADTWFSQNIPALLDYLWAHNGLLVITSDESSASDLSGCCSGGPAGLLPGFGGRVGLLALSRKLTPGRTVTTKYDHMSLLRTIEDSFGITEYLNNAARAAAMSDVLR